MPTRAELVDLLLMPLTVVAAIGYALIGRVFFAFSTFIMRALQRLFSCAFTGTAAPCCVLAAMAMIDWRGASSDLLIVGSVCCPLGTPIVTAAWNVPRNEASSIRTVAQDRSWTLSRVQPSNSRLQPGHSPIIAAIIT